jgi:ATP-dependent protease HslVU (ClpYQ) peptidase subunit
MQDYKEMTGVDQLTAAGTLADAKTFVEAIETYLRSNGYLTALKNIPTAETQRAQRKMEKYRKLRALCASAVKSKTKIRENSCHSWLKIKIGKL